MALQVDANQLVEREKQEALARAAKGSHWFRENPWGASADGALSARCSAPGCKGRVTVKSGSFGRIESAGSALVYKCPIKYEPKPN